jgi:L-lactate utilization protein LutB
MGQSSELVNWTFEKKCQKAVDALTKHGFTARYCSTPVEAAEYIVSAAADATSIGFGGSLSVAEIEVEETLRSQGKELLIHSVAGLSLEERLNIMRRQLTCDLFLTGTNALTLDGRLVNIDGVGNRAASMFFGPKKVIIVAGRNKLVDGDLNEAIRRVKEWASPPNAQRLNYKTPCATTGFCADCASPERICRVTTVIERKPRLTDIHVLVVNADMGL